MRTGRLLAVSVLMSFIGACGDNIQVSDVWPVEGRVVGPDGKKAKDLSGLACDRTAGFPRRCIVIDDESQSAQAVTLYDGRLEAGPVIPLISDTFGGDALELDGEAVAFGDGAFYVTGSHGHPRDRKGKLDPARDAREIAAKIKANSRLFRFQPLSDRQERRETADAGAVSSNRLREAIAASPILSPYMDKRLDQNGLTIEGLAVMNGRLFVGFRAPLLDRSKAAVMNVSLDAVFGSGSLDTQVALVDLGGRAIRDLSVRGSAIVILAGPSADEDGPSAVYLWDQKAPPALLGVLPDLEADEKPEAILPLDDPPGATRFLILFDGAKEGAPRAVAFK